MKRTCLFTAVLLLSVTVMAQTVTYEFAGTIDEIHFNDNNVFSEGYVKQPFSGWFSYSSDSDVTEIGAITFSLGTFQSSIIDDRCYALEESTSLYFSFYGTQGDYVFGRTGLTFTDNSGAAFEDDNQLLTFLTLSMFDDVEFSIQGYKKQGTVFLGNFSLEGQVTSLTLVPEPASMLLMLMGGLYLRRKQ